MTDPAARRFRYGVQVNSLGLTEAQPENNVQRIVLETLGVTLSRDARARAVQLPAWNEALGLPRPWDQQWSLRIQQVLAFESDLLEYPDLFDGSHVVEALTQSIMDGARAELDRVLEMGGVVAAVESGYLKSALVASLAERRRRVESGDEVVVGVNRFTETEPSPLTAAGAAPVEQVDPAGRGGTPIDGGQGVARAARRRPAVGRGPGPAARGRRVPADNLMPATLDCVRAGVTTGEWAGVLREVFGEYRAPTGLGRRRRRGAGAPCGRRWRGAGAGPRDRGRAGHRPAAAAGRQARPGRALQRGRADRRAGPRRRLRGDLPGHPAHPGRDRGGRGRGGRRPGRAVGAVRLAPARGAGRAATDCARPGSTSRSWSAASSRPRTSARCCAAGVARVFTPKDFEMTLVVDGLVTVVREANGLA